MVQDFGTSKSKKVVDQQRTNIVKDENISSAKAMHQIIMNKSSSNIDASLVKDGQSTGNVNNDANLNSMRAILPVFDLKTKEKMEMFDINSSKYFLIFFHNYYYYFHQ